MTEVVPPFNNPVIRYIDIFPGQITPKPSGVPEGRKLRIIVTDQYLTIGWDGKDGRPERVDIRLGGGDIGDDVTYAGGVIMPTTRTSTVSETYGYTVSRKAGCSTCGGGNKIRSWTPYPGAQFIEEPRKEVLAAQLTGTNRPMTGLIPPRYERRR